MQQERNVLTELSERELKQLLSCSLERVLNNAKWIAERAINSANEDIADRASILLDDLDDECGIKYLASRIWQNRQEIERARLCLEQKDKQGN